MKQLFCLVVLLVLRPVTAQEAPYVNAAVADSEFHKITADDMDRLRELKMLFGSRSFGYDMLYKGMDYLEADDAVYRFNDDVYNTDIVAQVDPAAADSHRTVHIGISADLYKRVDEMEHWLEDAPFYFQDDINVFMIYYHVATGALFPYYRARMDSMRLRNPHIRFIYLCSGFEDSTHTSLNDNSAAFADSVRRVYKGVVPVLDLGYILNDDGRCGNHYCSEYSTDPSGVHPNTGFILRREAKAVLVMLYKLFIENVDCSGISTAPSTPSELDGSALDRHTNRLTFGYADLPGCGVKEYMVRRDGVYIGTSTGFGYLDKGLTENTPYIYTVAAVGNNDQVSAWSAPCTLRTLNDTIGPTVTQVPEIIVDTSVTLVFSEVLDFVSASTAANYTLNNGASVLAATVEGSLVVLSTTPLVPEQDYVLSINGVTDNSVNVNPVAPGTEIGLRYTTKTVHSMLGWWPMDGNFADSSGSGLDGSASGTPVFTAGIQGQGLKTYADGSGYFRIPVNQTPRLDSLRNMSLAVWAKKDTADAGGYLYKHYLVQEMVITADQVKLRIWNTVTSMWVTADAPEIQDTEWHHYGFVYDGDSVALFVDGVRKSASAMTGYTNSYRNNFYVGYSPFETKLDGAMDDLRIYAWALSGTHMLQLYAMGADVNRDSLAVASILQTNGDSRTVADVAVFDSSGRVTQLYLQNDLGGTVFNLTSDIGQLTELTLLHLYGVQDHDHATALLSRIDPAIGSCTALTELIINDNDLASVPVSITGLTGLTSFSAGNNLLCSVDDTLRNWLDTYDPDWEESQSCTEVRYAAERYPKPDGAFSIRSRDGFITVVRPYVSGTMQVGIYTMTGMPVSSIRYVTGREAHVRTDGLPDGMYHFHVSDGSGTETLKYMLLR